MPLFYLGRIRHGPYIFRIGILNFRVSPKILPIPSAHIPNICHTSSCTHFCHLFGLSALVLVRKKAVWWLYTWPIFIYWPYHLIYYAMCSLVEMGWPYDHSVSPMTGTTWQDCSHFHILSFTWPLQSVIQPRRMWYSPLYHIQKECFLQIVADLWLTYSTGIRPQLYHSKGIDM